MSKQKLIVLSKLKSTNSFCLKVLIRPSKLTYSKISQICGQTFGAYFGQETPKNRKFDIKTVSPIKQALPHFSAQRPTAVTLGLSYEISFIRRIFKMPKTVKLLKINWPEILLQGKPESKFQRKNVF